MILHIDSATKNCSVSLAETGVLIYFREEYSESYCHSEKLHPFINEVLDHTKVHPKSLKAIAISKGPGSFTGLRIGVSAAKGICYALGIPLIGINTLQIMTQKVFLKPDEIVLSLLDARGSKVYALLLDHKHQVVGNTWIEHLDKPSFHKITGEKKLFVVGNGQEKLKHFLPDLEASFHPENRCPSSIDMVELAWKKYNAKEFEDINDFEPLYLSEFIPTKPRL
ncbi:MAG: tRNA (adenosine(37)-N6)-threonylcarbamoyltransferase complex dimerization subunit type 1 TsaB [Flavobacteriaceae bacterium]|nr:tRNA (adenosine(37)-N6)-threonylcarbamoyltransferase complex dimerization subunit type 1 TsaB [Flavobacteriaceae bacterium]